MSTLWSYTATEVARGNETGTRRGEMVAESPAEVRASLRRIGLQVIELQPIRKRKQASEARSTNAAPTLQSSLTARWHQHLRTRRRGERAEFFDALSTMLESGLPLLDSVETLMRSAGPRRRRRLQLRWSGSSGVSGSHAGFGGVGGAGGAMLVDLREQIRGGRSLDEAMESQPSWFDPTEVAMVRAAQHAGNLAPVLRRMAQQHERAGELSQRLASALAYPAIIAVVGIGVAIFLSLKTLPDLSRILESAGLAVPALTESVMSGGQFLARWWPLVLSFAAVSLLLLWAWPNMTERLGSGRRSIDVTPRVLRRIAVAAFSLRLSELLRTGVPVVEALRVLAPTVAGASLRAVLIAAAEKVERGEELSAALSDDRWFDAEYARLLEIGQASGELDVLLERIGRRYERAAKRLIDRLASLLEPCVILSLAVVIGVVVMAAILPLTRLQEVLR